MRRLYITEKKTVLQAKVYRAVHPYNQYNVIVNRYLTSFSLQNVFHTWSGSRGAWIDILTPTNQWDFNKEIIISGELATASPDGFYVYNFNLPANPTLYSPQQILDLINSYSASQSYASGAKSINLSDAYRGYNSFAVLTAKQSHYACGGASGDLPIKMTVDGVVADTECIV